MATRCVTTRRARSRAWRTRCASSRTSGTTRLPASVGVEQRTSATRSTSGLSGSCPIALTTGVRQRATARHSASSLNGSRSSTLPPPRASTMTSTSGAASSDCSAPMTCSTARWPWTATSRTSKRTAGQRRWAFSRTSRSAALARPVTSPTVRGRKGSGFLQLGGEQPLGGHQRLEPLQPGQQLAHADRPDLERLEAQGAAAGVELRLGVQHHPVALAQRRDDGVHQGARGDDVQAHVGDRVAQHQVAGARPPVDLGDLPLDPHPAELVDPLHERAGDGPHGQRRLRAVRQGHARQPRCGDRSPRCAAVRPTPATIFASRCCDTRASSHQDEDRRRGGRGACEV